MKIGGCQINYKATAKENLALDTKPHYWKKGIDYEVVEKDGFFKLASENGEVRYTNSVKDEVLENFEIQEESE